MVAIQPASGNPPPTGTLSIAAMAAFAGRFGEAEASLLHLVDQNSLPAIDLLARIKAQQGDLVESVRLWQRAAALHPENPQYLAAIARAYSLQRSTVSRHRLLVPVVVGLASLLLAVALTAYAIQMEEELEVLRSGQAHLATAVGAVDRQVEDLAAASQKREAELTSAIESARQQARLDTERSAREQVEALEQAFKGWPEHLRMLETAQIGIQSDLIQVRDWQAQLDKRIELLLQSR